MSLFAIPERRYGFSEGSFLGSSKMHLEDVKTAAGAAAEEDFLDGNRLAEGVLEIAGLEDNVESGDNLESGDCCSATTRRARRRERRL